LLKQLTEETLSEVERDTRTGNRISVQSLLGNLVAPGKLVVPTGIEPVFPT
jgi:hypothetical protein